MPGKSEETQTNWSADLSNLLARDFQASKPLEKLVTDITYLPLGQSMMYLSSIMDVFNGEIIAQVIGFKQDKKLVLDTLNQLPELPKGCMLHSGSRFGLHIICLSKKSKRKRNYHEYVP